MRRTLAVLLLAGAALLRADSPAPASDSLIVSPAHGWVLPIFTPEGYRSMILKGDEVRVRRDDRIDVVDVNITLFTGDASNRITTIILSPSASYFPHENEATGPSSVRVLRDNAELTGEDWTYDFRRGPGGTREKLSIRRNARVTLQTPLQDFLQ